MACLHLAPERVEAMGVFNEGGRTIVLALLVLVKLLRIRAKRIVDCRSVCPEIVPLWWSHVMLLLLRVKEQA